MTTWSFSPSRTIVFAAPGTQSNGNYVFALPTPVLPGKMPFDSADYLADFSNVMPPGDTISSTFAVTVSPSDLTVMEQEVTTGLLGASTAVAVRLCNGTALFAYAVAISIVTGFGNQFSRTFTLPILNGLTFPPDSASFSDGPVTITSTDEITLPDSSTWEVF